MRQEPPTFKGFITAFGGNWFTKMSVVQTGGHKGKDRVMRGESSNCEFWGRGQTDFRIGIGFDRQLAAQLKRAGKRVTPDRNHRREINGMIVEMTPNHRTQLEPGWTLS